MVCDASNTPEATACGPGPSNCFLLATHPEPKKPTGSGPNLDPRHDNAMNHCTTTFVFCATLAALAGPAQVHAQASASSQVTGPYIGAAFGAAFGHRESDDPNSPST